MAFRLLVFLAAVALGIIGAGELIVRFRRRRAQERDRRAMQRSAESSEQSQS